MSIINFGKKSYLLSILLILFILFPTSIFGDHPSWTQSSITISPKSARDTKPSDPPSDECKSTGSPCFVKDGNFIYKPDDLYIPSRGLPLMISRSYNSHDMFNGPFGHGWTFNYYIRLFFTSDGTHYNATVKMPNGQRHEYRYLGGTDFDPPISIWHTLKKNQDDTYALTLKGGGLKYTFSANGYLSSMEDTSGNRLDFSYNSSNQLERVQNNLGKYLQFSYYPNGKISQIADFAGRHVNYSYDAQGNLNAVQDPENRTMVYKYESPNPGQEHFLTSITDNWGRIVAQEEYYPNDKLKSYTEKGETYSYVYNGQSSRTAKTDSLNNTTDIHYSSYGVITQIFDPYGKSRTYSYDSDYYNLIELKDEEGIITRYAYNNGKLSQITKAAGTAEEVIWNYVYDENFPEEIKRIQAPAGYPSWEFEYYSAGGPSAGRLFKIYRIQSDGQTKDLLSVYSYNEYGQTTSITDALGKVTAYQYDPASGFLSSIAYPKNSDSGSNPTYAYAYDGLGRIQSITDPLGRATSYTYDSLGRNRTVTLPRPDPGFPDNFVLTYTYDNYEEVGGKKLVYIAQEDPNGRVSKYYYDEFNQLVRVVDAAGKVSQFVYDKGDLIHLQDANLNTTSYEYDKLYRLSTVHHPAGPTSSYTYYGDGLLKTKTDGKGQTITYVYDKLKRLKEKQYPDGKKIIYTYSGQMIGNIQDQVANETTSFSYDQSYRLSSVLNPRGQISYTYSATDQVQSYQVNSDPPVAYTYYDDGSVKNITRSGDSPLVYYYLLSGQRAQVLYPNNARADYAYDDQGRLTGIINRKPDMTVLSSYAYGYDYDYSSSSYTMKGFRTSMTNHLAQMEKYSFDNLYQLNRVDYPNGDVYQWSYDDIGNRVQQVVIPSGQPPVVNNYTYYQNSQSKNSQLLQSDGTNTYTWDNNGNLLAKGSTNYTWDYDNRLTGINGGSVSTTYSYNYMGDRIKKMVAGVETGYLYQAEDIVKETSGGIVTDYLHGIRIDDPVVLNRSGAKSYYFGDGLGSVRELTDAAGTVQNDYSYGAWGEIRTQNTTITNCYGYTGREFAEEGMHFYRARYLDPSLGRLVSEDPIGLYGGINLYIYVHNMPCHFIDPFGLIQHIENDPLINNERVKNKICCMWQRQYVDKTQGGDRIMKEQPFMVVSETLDSGEDYVKTNCGREAGTSEHDTHRIFTRYEGEEFIGWFHSHPQGDNAPFSDADKKNAFQPNQKNQKDIPIYALTWPNSDKTIIFMQRRYKGEEWQQQANDYLWWCVQNRKTWENDCCPKDPER